MPEPGFCPRTSSATSRMRFRVSSMERARADSICTFALLHDSVQQSRLHIGVQPIAAL
jgi:hypothetical protein